MKKLRARRSNQESGLPRKRQNTRVDVVSPEERPSDPCIDQDVHDTQDRDIPATRTDIKRRLKERLCLAYQFMPPATNAKVEYDDQCAHKASETIVKLCRVLELSHTVVLTALVYLQMYKNSSRCWLKDESSTSAKGQPPPREMRYQDQFIIAGACILLAWKYREDDLRVSKSSRKIFELSSAIYRMYTGQHAKCPGLPSVSGWMLQDEGHEINRLKNQLIERESHLLRSIDYQIGPVSLPQKLMPAYLRRFLIAIAGDISELHQVSETMENLVGVLILECYKTQICIDYKPPEILVACIFKAICLLSVAGIYTEFFTPSSAETKFSDHANEMDTRLQGFIGSLGRSISSIERISQCLWDMRRYTQLFKEEKTP